MIKIKCKTCNHIRKFSCKAELNRRNKTGLCRSCYLKNTSGKNNSNYKRGYFIRSGYKFILKRDHPYCNNLGYVREHRLVMENHLGRYLIPEEIVHHINGDKLDNRIENLEITKQSAHAKNHMTKNRTCDICDRKHLARGFCDKHYWKLFLKEKRSSK